MHSVLLGGTSKFQQKKMKFFFTVSSIPRKIRTTDKKIIKIHQLEQILANVPMLVHCALLRLAGNPQLLFFYCIFGLYGP